MLRVWIDHFKDENIHKLLLILIMIINASYTVIMFYYITNKGLPLRWGSHHNAQNGSNIIAVVIHSMSGKTCCAEETQIPMMKKKFDKLSILVHTQFCSVHTNE